MKSVETTGKSVEEAVMNGLAQLKAAIDEVDIEILQGGSKGLFGLGTKESRVRLTLKNNPATTAQRFLEGLFERMGLKVTIDIDDRDDELYINLSGDSMGVLIGHRGETLDALQFLTSLVVNREEKCRRVRLDTENYRKKRENTLVKLANRIAAKVRANGIAVALEPMMPYERRILHETLQKNQFVTTQSEGEEPNRHVVIKPR